MVNLIFIILHILAAIFNFVLLFVTLPSHAIYLVVKDKNKNKNEKTTINTSKYITQPKIEGMIAYFGLTDWWMSEFTEKQRQHILQTIYPNGQEGFSLTKGMVAGTSLTAIHALSNYPSRFKNTNDIVIANSFFKKAESLIDDQSNIEDVHLLYGKEINYYKKHCNQEKLIEACKKQIAYTDISTKFFKKEYANVLPNHSGYNELIKIMEKQEKYSDAIKLLRDAKKQGWIKKEYAEKQISQYKNKMNELKNFTTEPQ